MFVLNSPMTYSEFLTDWRTQCASQPELRRGQALMNLLFEVRPDLYDQVNMSALDSFYTDEPLPSLLTILNEQWEQ